MSADALAQLDKLWQRGQDFLGSRYAILGGAMTWVSERGLVAAISNAGAFGVLASGAMPPELLRAEIQATRQLTTKPFGVNLICLHPKLLEMVDVCIAEQVTHVVFAGGIPPQAAVDKLTTVGIKVVGLPTTLALAKKMIRMGCQALVLEGMEAGGHIGPVSTTVLAQEILPHIREVPIFMAGGIGRGEAILGYLEMGAAGCQLGTRFVCATESIAHPKFKQAFINANARDAQPSVALDNRFPVIPVRALANQGVRDFMVWQKQVIARFDNGELDAKAAQMEIEHFWAGALRRAVQEGDVERGSLMAGQSVGMVETEQPVATIIQELLDQILTTLTQRQTVAA